MLYMRSFLELCRRLKEIFRSFSGLSFSCESKVETPYVKCLKGFNRVYGDCMRVVILQPLCHLVPKVRDFFCPFLDLAMELLCSFPKFIMKAIKEIGKALLGDLLETLKRDLLVKVEVESSFNHTINVSVTKAGYADLVLDRLLEYFPSHDLIEALFNLGYTILMFVLICKPIRDIYKFQRDMSYDNRYVSTTAFAEEDAQRVKQGKPPVLPLSNTDREEFLDRIIPEFSINTVVAGLKTFLKSYWHVWAICLPVLSVLSAYKTMLFFKENILSGDHILPRSTNTSSSINYTKYAQVLVDRIPEDSSIGMKQKMVTNFMNNLVAQMQEEAGNFERLKLGMQKIWECQPKLLHVPTEALKTISFGTVTLAFATTFILFMQRVKGTILEYFFPELKKPRAQNLM